MSTTDRRPVAPYLNRSFPLTGICPPHWAVLSLELRMAKRTVLNSEEFWVEFLTGDEKKSSRVTFSKHLTGSVSSVMVVHLKDVGRRFIIIMHDNGVVEWNANSNSVFEKCFESPHVAVIDVNPDKPSDGTGTVTLYSADFDIGLAVLSKVSGQLVHLYPSSLIFASPTPAAPAPQQPKTLKLGFHDGKSAGVVFTDPMKLRPGHFSTGWIDVNPDGWHLVFISPEAFDSMSSRIPIPERIPFNTAIVYNNTPNPDDNNHGVVTALLRNYGQTYLATLRY